MRIIGFGCDGDLNLTSVTVEEDGCEYRFENPRWISVEERLPEGEVLAANFAPGTHGYKEYIIGYVDEVKCTEPDWHRCKCYASNDHEILNDVTHWMPLPEPPEKEDTDD